MAPVCTSQRLLNAPSLIRPLVLSPPRALSTRTPYRTHCKQRLNVTASLREGEPQEDNFEGLSQEEDWTVPGGAFDSLSSNTKLGKAVQEACDELDTLVTLERQSLRDAQDMLKKLGYRGNILESGAPQEDSPAAPQIQQILEATDDDRSKQA